MFTGADIPPVAYVKVDKYSIRMTLKYSTKNIAGTRFVDGGLHGVCFCSASRICCCQSIGCSISTAIESNENDFAVAIDEHMEKGQCQAVAMFDGTNVRSRKATAQNTPTSVQVINFLLNSRHKLEIEKKKIYF
jgi:hypothetical protein